MARKSEGYQTRDRKNAEAEQRMAGPSGVAIKENKHKSLRNREPLENRNG